MPPHREGHLADPPKFLCDVLSQSCNQSPNGMPWGQRVFDRAGGVAPDVPSVMAQLSRLFLAPESRYHIEQRWMAGAGDQATWSFEVVDRAFDRRRLPLDAAMGL